MQRGLPVSEWPVPGNGLLQPGRADRAEHLRNMHTRRRLGASMRSRQFLRRLPRECVLHHEGHDRLDAHVHVCRHEFWRHWRRMRRSNSPLQGGPLLRSANGDVSTAGGLRRGLWRGRQTSRLPWRVRPAPIVCGQPGCIDVLPRQDRRVLSRRRRLCPRPRLHLGPVCSAWGHRKVRLLSIRDLRCNALGKTRTVPLRSQRSSLSCWVMLQPAISPDGGLFPGACPQVIPDGHSASGGNTYASCDTFAESFLADYHFMNGAQSPAGSCTLLDSVVCK